MACDILLIVAMIIFLLKYRKTMQAMLAAFLQINTKNSGIQSLQLVTSCDNLCKLHCFNIFTGVFVKIFCIWNIITGLYQVVCQCGHFPAPVPKLKRDKCELNYKPIQSAPLIDEYTTGIQTRPTLVLDDNSPLLTPLMTEEYTLKAVFQPTKQLKSAADTTSKVKLLSAK